MLMNMAVLRIQRLFLCKIRRVSMSRYVETNLEPCETPEMEIFMQRVNS